MGQYTDKFPSAKEQNREAGQNAQAHDAREPGAHEDDEVHALPILFDDDMERSKGIPHSGQRCSPGCPVGTQLHLGHRRTLGMAHASDGHSPYFEMISSLLLCGMSPETTLRIRCEEPNSHSKPLDSSSGSRT